MKIISFAYTTTPLLAGAKTVTRRDWSDAHARRFKAGELVAAYDRSPRFKGRQVATIRLVADPVSEQLSEMPDSDYEAEGFRYLFEHPDQLPKTLFGKPCTREDFSFAGFDRWRKSGGKMWVVRFEMVSQP